MKKKPSIKQTYASKASLREIPEQRLVKGNWRRNPYIDRIRKDGLTFQIEGEEPIVLRRGAGRPKRGEEVGPTVTLTLRLPARAVDVLKASAKKAGTTVHAEVRAAVAERAAKQRRSA